EQPVLFREELQHLGEPGLQPVSRQARRFLEQDVEIRIPERIQSQFRDQNLLPEPVLQLAFQAIMPVVRHQPDLLDTNPRRVAKNGGAIDRRASLSLSSLCRLHWAPN